MAPATLYPFSESSTHSSASSPCVSSPVLALSPTPYPLLLSPRKRTTRGDDGGNRTGASRRPTKYQARRKGGSALPPAPLPRTPTPLPSRTSPRFPRLENRVQRVRVVVFRWGVKARWESRGGWGWLYERGGGGSDGGGGRKGGLLTRFALVVDRARPCLRRLEVDIHVAFEFEGKGWRVGSPTPVA
ncbi:uncharacterized protein SCHCODRAFT_02237272 [Schizophyllum commune H4-8]|uniref:uncharacterized protein n=1 Tax=Schizophyllum commune (strain H4-8 / FGSC 9210) TaxID=578458 RepID=UPI002160A5DC|nr:uncharacterized protein SCHCODRAFT_02237272 [Schizophyllum commune H4-8]KAI5895662.1 hypothetical protein SCHCODRAFT_02237272 [Schizophyllum commune H4-8]